MFTRSSSNTTTYYSMSKPTKHSVTISGRNELEAANFRIWGFAALQAADQRRVFIANADAAVVPDCR